MGSYDLAVGDDVDFDGDDLFGDDDDLMGADLELGGGRPRKGRGAPARRVQPVNQRQVLSFPQGPNGAALFTASQSGTVEARPQRVFQCDRFVVPSTVAPFFVMSDLVIGRDSMLVNSQSVALEVFSQTGVGVGLSGYIARPGIDVTLSLENIDTGASHAFYGSIVGRCLT